MKKREKILKIAIDSPAAAGAGTLAKQLAKSFNLLYVDTGKLYRLAAYYRLKYPKKFNLSFLKKKISRLNINDLQKKELISDEVGTEASIISKNINVRNIVHNIQIKAAYNPPSNYSGSCLDGRDITYNIIPDADFKFFITANLKVRALRRFKELKKLNTNITYSKVLKSIKNRDYSDFNRKVAPLKKTKDSILINTSNLTKRACFLKIKKLIDNKLKNNGNL
ncbi:(d)CMP kinase [Candidatus Pelagibacter sp.]|uniref:(d)CMP kinase n=1 Tax=Candidatus Pelagibacter sp. TaxID=2024849 RepID=UPI003F82CFE1